MPYRNIADVEKVTENKPKLSFMDNLYLSENKYKRFVFHVLNCILISKVILLLILAFTAIAFIIGLLNAIAILALLVVIGFFICTPYILYDIYWISEGKDEYLSKLNDKKDFK